MKAATPMLGLALIPLLAIGLAIAGVVAMGARSDPESSPSQAAGDIPPRFLELYRAAADRFELGADGWSYLAGVGKIECDHGRSTAYGCDRGEQNYAGAAGPAQFLAGTWASYGVDADRDGSRDVYDPADAVFGMANYLRASGAPGDWRQALFAYNHSQAYVSDVVSWAERYRAETQKPGAVAQPATGGWLVSLPGHPGIRCDERIVADALAIERRWGVRVTACFGGYPHATLGEHPLGLATDIVPADGDWDRTLRLAESAGWAPGCASSGCAGAGPLRVVLYNGFPNHGDPAHTANPHLHLSWAHAAARPFSRAAWVRTLLPPGAARRRCSEPSRPQRPRRSGAGGSCRG